MNLKINAMVAVVIPEEKKDPIAIAEGLEKFLNEGVFVKLEENESVKVKITMNTTDIRVGYPPMPKVKPPRRDDDS